MVVPFSLLTLCTILLPPSVLAAQQCRLVPPKGYLAVPTPTSTPSSYGTVTASGLVEPTAALVYQPFAYGGSTPVRGVNLGGWFVLEPWITPSIFQNTGNAAIIDEYTFGQMQDYNTALGILQAHWASWITEDDFKQIAAAGLNHVRIPIGYWAVPLTASDTNQSTSVAPYIPGAWPYLLTALNWAKAHGVHVVLDLHGAPDSQNGYDNSGQRGTANWQNNPSNVTRTLDTIRFMAEKVGGMIDVIELLNEPAGFYGAQFVAVLQGYFQNGYTEVRQVAGGGLQVMLGDAFLGVGSWDGFLTFPAAQGVLMDTHVYQVFSDAELDRTFDEHIAYACTLTSSLVAYANANLYTVIGEWSTAVTDCAEWLNGRGVGARWDGSYGPGQQVHGSCTGYTGSYSTFSQDYKNFLRQFWEVQVDVAESIQGWFYWTWKNEVADEWSYSKGLAGGWIPQDPTARAYPNACQSYNVELAIVQPEGYMGAGKTTT